MREEGHIIENNKEEIRRVLNNITLIKNIKVPVEIVISVLIITKL